MKNKYTMYGGFLASTKKPGEKIKLIMIRDSRGVCIIEEKDWRKMIKR